MLMPPSAGMRTLSGSLHNPNWHVQQDEVSAQGCANSCAGTSESQLGSYAILQVLSQLHAELSMAHHVHAYYTHNGLFLLVQVAAGSAYTCWIAG
jgi:hypothetical protein